MPKFNIRLKELRNAKAITQQSLADKLGTSKSSINMYERGAREPGLDMLEALADFFNVDLDYLLGKTDIPRKGIFVSSPALAPTSNTFSLHSREQKHMDTYRQLNDEGKDQADDYVTMLAETPKYTDTPLDKVQTSIIYYDIPVSAGTGQFLSDSGYIMLDLTETPPSGAEFVVRVCGDSMKPTYKDGDKLYIAPAERLSVGDIGIFSVNGDVFVKEYGAKQLISHNPEYAPIPINDGDAVHCFGKVVGVCKKYR